MQHHFLDYRDWLKSEFNCRSNLRPSYSLRKFAKDLGLTSSRLSEVFSGKQGLSRPIAEKISDRLGFSNQDKAHFCDLVEAKHARSHLGRQTAKLRLRRFREGGRKQLDLEYFKIISLWYHFAILELTHIKGFRSDTDWIARRLGISKEEARSAVKRLMGLGLLGEKDGRWISTETVMATPTDIPSDAIKSYHSQILQKAARALYETDVNIRDFSSITLGFDRRQMTLAKEKIRSFRRQFEKEMSEIEGYRDEGNRVYSLAIQLFPLDKGPNYVG